MSAYRCYFLDGQDHITAVENIQADALGVAIEQALAMLKARPHHHAIEIWQDTRKVYPAREEASPGWE
jgi:hypothetical protein